MIKFRKRIGEKGSEQLLKMSVQLFPRKEVQEDEVLLDTTVQEKNITFPTDVKLQKKIIEKCRKIADKERVKLRQTYKRELKQLMIDQRFHSHPSRKKKARAAARRIKVIEGWNKRLNATKTELPDYEEMVASSDVVVSDQVRDAILESDVGPRILYHLAENPEIAEKISKSSLITALREIGKLEARFEKNEPKEVKTVAKKSNAPAPISPLKGTSSEQAVITDTDKMTFAQYKAMRQAKRIR